AILAHIDGPVGVAEEEAVAAGPGSDAHRFDVAWRGRWDAARQMLPMLAVVVAAQHRRAGVMRLPPHPGMAGRAGHEERLLVRREADVIGIGEAEALIGHARPMAPAVLAAIGAASGGHEHAL